MSFLEALLLGLVQGLTEFLPVSSSGHMAILENLFMKNSSTGLLFDAMLHLGTLMAVLAVFKQDIKRLLLELCKMIYDCCVNITTYFHNKNHQDARRYKRLLSNNYRKLLVLLLTATIPTAVEGLLLEHLAEQAGRNLLAPAMGFFVTGILLLIADFFSAGDKIPKNVGYGAALLIGVFQGMAIFPEYQEQVLR